MKIIFAFCLSLLTLTLSAQKLKVKAINKGFTKVLDEVESFDYLADNLDSTKYVWVANIEVKFSRIEQHTIPIAFKEIKERSNSLGGNAFRVLNSDVYSKDGNNFIEVAVFWLNREDRQENFDLFNKDEIYLFGFLGHHKDIDGYHVAVNEEKLLIQELTYKKMAVSVNDTVNIDLKKGMKTNSLTFIQKPRPEWQYLSFHLYKGAFNVGEIRSYNMEIGEFLKRILKEVD